MPISTSTKLGVIDSKKQQKAIFKVESPFKNIECTQISKQHQETLLQLLCALLRPLGDLRRTNTQTKTASKRKRKHSEAGHKLEVGEETARSSRALKPSGPTQCVLVGVNSVTRQLEIEVSRKQDRGNTPTLVMVLITGSRDSIVYSHLPIMCALASQSSSAEHATRLVYLDAEAQTQLSRTLALPRVGVIGVVEEEGPESSTALRDLITFGRDHLSSVKCSVLDQSAEGLYRPLKVI